MNKNSVLVLKKALLALFLFFFTACSMPDDEKAAVMKILEIRESLVNSGKTNKLAVILTDDFQNKKEYLDQEKYRNFYFTEYDRTMNSVDFISYNPLTKNAETLINFDLSFKNPQDVAATVLLGKYEKVMLKKEPVGWKISKIEEVKESGKKVEPQLVHDIFYPLDTRKTAISNNDYELFETAIHPDFAERETLLSDFKKNAEVFSEINYNLKGRQLLSVSPDRNNAEVIQYFDLFFKTKEGNLSEKLENRKEIISLKKTAEGTWKIISGLR